MSVATFNAKLAGCQKVGLDTAALRLYLGGDKRHAGLTLALFEAIERGRVAAVASMLSLSELLVAPYRAGDEAAVQDFNVLLPTFPNLSLVPLDQGIADRAAAWQAKFGLDPASSVQAATAAMQEVDALVAGDRSLLCLNDVLDVIVLGEYL